MKTLFTPFLIVALFTISCSCSRSKIMSSEPVGMGPVRVEHVAYIRLSDTTAQVTGFVFGVTVEHYVYEATSDSGGAASGKVPFLNEHGALDFVIGADRGDTIDVEVCDSAGVDCWRADIIE